jgi:hypothetical protein
MPHISHEKPIFAVVRLLDWLDLRIPSSKAWLASRAGSNHRCRMQQLKTQLHPTLMRLRILILKLQASLQAIAANPINH